ncbi:MAG: universal stress protein [Gammaproteobacteria bacterium]|nr:universal stress protein [Gammaproteobacteria bacterium]MDH3447290.1 universal stress protein [Gammaproteobacteria bacterium]
MFKSIVVAYDGSAHSGRALDIGTDLAKQGKIPLGIIFVVESSHLYIPEDMRKMGEVEHLIDPTPKMIVNFENAPATMMSSMAQASADSQAAMFQYADFIVEQAQRHARDEGVAEVETSVVMGNPAEEIVAFASDRKADLIITGSRGFGKLKSLLLGSTSHRVTQLAKCSCLTVK